MLIISRRLGEGFIIDGNIQVTVVKIGKGRIRLGVAAPSSVRIHRQEQPASAFENPDRIELVGGSSLAQAVAPMAFPLKES
jgi:carbon storage regulator